MSAGAVTGSRIAESELLDSAQSGSATAASTPASRSRAAQEQDPPSNDSGFYPASWPKWARIYPGRGMYKDIKARAPYYVSDWTDAWNYRVVPATVQMFFANVLPALAFALDLYDKTDRLWGVTEVLLASFMASFIFAIFAGQPLCIVGVTGPITVLNYTIYEIIPRDEVDILHFVGWVYLWSAIMHVVIAVCNGVNFLRYVTRFSCDTFGFYVAWVYLQYGVQVITRAFAEYDNEEAILTVLVAVLMLVVSFLFDRLSKSTFLHRIVRRIFADYGMPLTVVATSGFPHWGRLNQVTIGTLPTGPAYLPTNGREWLVRFWELPGKWVGIAFPFGILLTILFYFDHNVSSLIAQGSEFPLRKPPSFHYDFFILGITTFIAGLLGLPAPNGLIPQAPIHTQSLLVTKRVPRTETKTKSDPKKDDDERDARVQDARAPAEKEMGGEKRREAEMEKHDERVAAHGVEHSSHGDGRAAEGAPSTNRRKLASRLRDYNTNGGVSGSSSSSPDPHSHLTDLEDSVSYVEQPISVVEQRVSNLAQGSLCLVVMAGPLLHHVVGLIPRGVLAGLFWYMGAQALESNGITSKLFYLLRDRHHTPRHPRDEPLRKCRKSAVLAFAAIELLGFAATFAITNTIAAIGFPVIILLLVPLRTWVMPRLPFFTKEELAVLDAPTASEFTMESVGGSKT